VLPGRLRLIPTSGGPDRAGLAILERPMIGPPDTDRLGRRRRSLGIGENNFYCLMELTPDANGA